MNQEQQQSEYIKYWLLLRRKWLPATIVFVIIFALSIVNALRKPNIFRASGTLLFKSQDNATSLIGLEELAGQATSQEKNIAQEIAVLKTEPVLKKVLELVPPSALEEHSVEKIEENLNVDLNPLTGVIEVSFNSRDPKFAQNVVNRLMDLFLQRNIRENRASTVAAGQFISQQLPLLQNNVLRASEALQKFQETHNLVSPESGAESSGALLSGNQEALARVEQELAGVNTELSNLKGQLGIGSAEESLKVSDFSQSPKIQQLISSFRQAREELAVAQNTLTPNHPILIGLTDKEARVRSALIAEGVNPDSISDQIQGPEIGETRQELNTQIISLESQKLSLAERRKVILQEQSIYQSRLATLPSLQKEYRELLRQLQAAELTYDTLLKRLQEIRVTENQTIPNVEIIEPGKLLEFPVSPNRLTEIIRGAIAALLLGYLTAYLLDRFDPRIRTVEDVKTFYPFPTLGSIPELKSKGNNEKMGLEMIEHPNSSIAEGYRMIQANLKFLQSDKALQIIAVSSAIPSEGKSTTTANLGLALSESHRVLLIDSDLRRPKQHQIWEADNRYGFSNLLADVDKPFSSVLKHITKHDNLNILPAGSIPPNPVTLLESQRLKNFLAWAREAFDYVLIDLPPLTVAADSMFAAKHSDGLLLVARPNRLNRTAAIHCLNTINQAHINILGMVVNGVIIGNEPNSYYYYQTYYNNDYFNEREEKEESNSISKAST